jgi:Domain of unknown function (DUF4262)
MPNTIATDRPLTGTLCHFLEVHLRYYPDYIGLGSWYYRKRTFPLYQIAWPNTEGCYAWTNSTQRRSKNGNRCWLGSQTRRAGLDDDNSHGCSVV